MVSVVLILIFIKEMSLKCSFIEIEIKLSVFSLRMSVRLKRICNTSGPGGQLFECTKCSKSADR